MGDDDQSIYSWRGADPTNILRFSKIFPGAKIVKLEQNYRSTQSILSVANAVIANNTDRYGKKLWTQNSEGVLVTHAVAPSDEEEARFVVRKIVELHAQESRSYRDFSVLYRSNKQSQILEEELRREHVPYVMYGGQQFYERKEVKDIIAYLRIALNDRDEIALRRIVNYPARGIGPTTVQALVSWSRARRVTLWRCLCEVDEAPTKMRAHTIRSIRAFVDILERLRKALHTGSASAAIRALMEDIHLLEDFRSGSPSLRAAQRRADNVQSLLNSMERFQQQNYGTKALTEYLRQLSLSNKEEEQVTGDRVTLTTLHSAKGLEFPIVFLVGMEEEIIPHARTLAPHSTDVDDPDHAATIAEERRLAYVGITRAKEKLVLSRSEARIQRGKLKRRTPSRFLLEIPEDLLCQRDLSAEAMQPVEPEELRQFFQSF